MESYRLREGRTYGLERVFSPLTKHPEKGLSFNIYLYALAAVELTVSLCKRPRTFAIPLSANWI